MNDASAFERESHRIDEQIWDALAMRSGERALFLGVANDGRWIARAVEIGVDVTVVVASEPQIALVERLGAAAMRGSATMIGAGEGSYDLASAIHYLHEIDPGFHMQVVSELARVARRVAIVEPSPPVDPLGKRIAALYARAKREGGQFETYQPIEYWRKLLAIVKADVWQNLFTFTRVPPRHAVTETISLVLDAMAIEEMPQAYLDELRALASRRDAQLLPLSRIVLVGTASGVPLPQGSGSAFRPGVTSAPPQPILAQQSPPPVPVQAGPAPPLPPRGRPTPPEAPLGFGFAPELAPVPPPPDAPVAPSAPAQPPPAQAPFGAPFALPPDDESDPPGEHPGQPHTGFGWAWEPPEEKSGPS